MLDPSEADRVCRNEHYRNERIQCDGVWFENCVLEDCIIAYDGGKLMFSGCAFPGSRWQFGGPLQLGLARLGATFGLPMQDDLFAILRAHMFPTIEIS